MVPPPAAAVVAAVAVCASRSREREGELFCCCFWGKGTRSLPSSHPLPPSFSLAPPWQRTWTRSHFRYVWMLVFMIFVCMCIVCSCVCVPSVFLCVSMCVLCLSYVHVRVRTFCVSDLYILVPGAYVRSGVWRLGTHRATRRSCSTDAI